MVLICQVISQNHVIKMSHVISQNHVNKVSYDIIGKSTSSKVNVLATLAMEMLFCHVISQDMKSKGHVTLWVGAPQGHVTLTWWRQ